MLDLLLLFFAEVNAIPIVSIFHTLFILHRKITKEFSVALDTKVYFFISAAHYSRLSACDKISFPSFSPSSGFPSLLLSYVFHFFEVLRAVFNGIDIYLLAAGESPNEREADVLCSRGEVVGYFAPIGIAVVSSAVAEGIEAKGQLRLILAQHQWS